MEISQARRSIFRGLFIILLVSAGCSRPTQTLPIPILTPTKQPQATSTTASTLIPAPTNTIHPTPSQAATKLPTSTASPTTQPTSSPTFQPSLQPTEALLAFEKFLSLGMDCSSPCFFGIIPGQTTFDQAVNVLNWLRGSIFHSVLNEQYYSSHYYYLGLSLPVVLEIENGIVKNIELDIGMANPLENPNPRLWQGFLPDALLKKYGNPSQVRLGLVASPSPPDSPPENIKYNLILYFDSLDLTVVYELGHTLDTSVLEICPLSDPFEAVRIFLGKIQNTIYQPDYGISLEEVSSLSLDQFSELMFQPSQSPCIEIPKAAFGPTYDQ